MLGITRLVEFEIFQSDTNGGTFKTLSFARKKYIPVYREIKLYSSIIYSKQEYYYIMIVLIE